MSRSVELVTSLLWVAYSGDHCHSCLLYFKSSSIRKSPNKNWHLFHQWPQAWTFTSWMYLKFYSIKLICKQARSVFIVGFGPSYFKKKILSAWVWDELLLFWEMVKFALCMIKCIMHYFQTSEYIMTTVAKSNKLPKTNRWNYCWVDT